MQCPDTVLCSFGHYSMGSTTQSYRIPCDRQICLYYQLCKPHWLTKNLKRLHGTRSYIEYSDSCTKCDRYKATESNERDWYLHGKLLRTSHVDVYTRNVLFSENKNQNK